jgi:heterodisulfide reductase subunit C
MNVPLPLNRSRNSAFLAEVESLSGQKVSTCYQCGNCTAGCPAGFAYDMQANQVMRALQLGLKEQVLGSRSLWMCLSCSTCSLRCPNDIDVAAVMETLRHMARREGKVNVPKVEKFWTSFLGTVRAFGRSYEIGTMALYMLRSLRLTTDVDLAPDALRKSKLPFKPHIVPGDGAKAVGRILQRYADRVRGKGGVA